MDNYLKEVLKYGFMISAHINIVWFISPVLKILSLDRKYNEIEMGELVPQNMLEP
jgi:hypothetical protein